MPHAYVGILSNISRRHRRAACRGEASISGARESSSPSNIIGMKRMRAHNEARSSCASEGGGEAAALCGRYPSYGWCHGDLSSQLRRRAAGEIIVALVPYLDQHRDATFLAVSRIVAHALRWACVVLLQRRIVNGIVTSLFLACVMVAVGEYCAWLTLKCDASARSFPWPTSARLFHRCFNEMAKWRARVDVARKTLYYSHGGGAWHNGGNIAAKSFEGITAASTRAASAVPSAALARGIGKICGIGGAGLKPWCRGISGVAGPGEQKMSLLLHHLAPARRVGPRAKEAGCASSAYYRPR